MLVPAILLPDLAFVLMGGLQGAWWAQSLTLWGLDNAFLQGVVTKEDLGVMPPSVAAAVLGAYGEGQGEVLGTGHLRLISLSGLSLKVNRCIQVAPEAPGRLSWHR